MRLIQTILIIVTLVSIASLPSGCQEEQKSQLQPEPQSQPEPQPQAESQPQAEPKKQAKAGKIQVEKPVYDFGVIGPSKSYKGEFKFKNVGEGTLKINKVKSTCGCTVPQLKKKTYAPGESGTINVTYRSSSRQAPVTKHLYVESNDSANPKFELTIKAKVELSIIVSPQKLKLSIKEENAGISPITITSKDKKSFSIKSFSATKDIITVDFDPAAQANKFVLEPKVDIEKLREVFKGNIKIEVTHPQSKQINVSFEAEPLFEVSRPRFIIQNAEPGVPVTKEIFVMNNYGDTVEIESVSSTKQHMAVINQERIKEDVKLMVQVTPPPKTEKSRSFTDTLKVKLKSGELLTVRCSCFYKK